MYKHPYVNGGKPLKQVMVPEKLRRPIMEVAHGSIMGGHMGIKKTTDKIQSAFYWPGIQGDVTRFCKSCDVCQKTVSKGSVPKVPLEKMPLIDKPFKRVAKDLFGPISPPSEEGHRYILTLVDVSTRYPEAVVNWRKPSGKDSTITTASLKLRDHNKLLMQCKGPFEVSSVVGLNDYKVKVKGKEKVYHANLLKKYFEREETTVEGAVAVGAGATSIDDAVDCAAKVDEAEEEEVDFLELGGYVAKESIEDVTTGPNLTHEQQNEFTDLAKQFTNLFTEAPGTTDLVQHHIKLTSDEPVRSRPYPVPYSMRESLRKDIADMIKMGVIRESSSPYASPVVVVKKKDNTNHVCVDYRKLNKLTVFDPEPMPTAEHLFHKLSGDKFYSKIGLSKGYWQITIPEEYIPKTAFVTPEE